ncbi:MAG TPA: hypothetical protein VFY18_02430 [Candidatus Limnocylindrales bacterium]|nr:hypothetical protein [Candidatus Limnocylindrales bacterium]
MTDGTEIVWSRGGERPSTAPDLYRYVPDAASPEIVFQNPNRDSTIDLLTVHGGRYAFAESNRRLYGENGFRLWLLPTIGATPVLIDQSDWKDGEPTPPLPFMALNDERLVWTTVHHASGRLQFQLLSYDIATATTDVLVSSDARNTEYWFPTLADDDQHVVFATVEHDEPEVAFHVKLLELDGSARVRNLDHLGHATWPAITGSTAIWKHVDRNVLDAGVLERASIDQPGLTESPLAELSTRANDPSAGDRFVAAWRDDDTDLVVYDLRSNRPVTIEAVPAGKQEGLERPVVHGNLLVYVRGFFDAQPLQLCWVRLPS